jgi:hypothetical protein
MRPFRCSVCEQLLFFDNSVCLQCGSTLGFVADERDLVPLRPVDGVLERVDGSRRRYRHCANALVARCNWVLAADDDDALCRSCRLTSVRPNDNEVEAIAAFADAEAAKRRLLDQLTGLGLPVIDRTVDEARGVAFELLSSRGQNVTTGHEAGVITLDLSESDAAHREFVRQQLGEPYRTVLGHLRHEIAHYYWPLLVVDGCRVDEFRALFGDERSSYEDALAQHYSQGAAQDWSGTHVSQYATMHPWEDWAETFAHYLHIDDGLDTAAAFGLAASEPVVSAARQAQPRSSSELSVGPRVQSWLSLTLALNAMSRSIGQGDLYPFVLSPTVVEKLDFVHRAVIDGRVAG